MPKPKRRGQGKAPRVQERGYRDIPYPRSPLMPTMQHFRDVGNASRVRVSRMRAAGYKANPRDRAERLYSPRRAPR